MAVLRHEENKVVTFGTGDLYIRYGSLTFPTTGEKHGIVLINQVPDDFTTEDCQARFQNGRSADVVLDFHGMKALDDFVDSLNRFRESWQAEINEEAARIVASAPAEPSDDPAPQDAGEREAQPAITDHISY